MKRNWFAVLYLTVIFGWPIPVGCAWVWWAHRQAALWQSQGVNISVFDVMMGIRPAGSPGK